MGFINKLKDKFEEIKETLLSQEESVDLAQFNDPLAESIRWTPLEKGGTNICSHRLIFTPNNIARFKPTLATYLFAGAFILLGSMAIIFPITEIVKSDHFEFMLLAPIALGSLFCLLGFWLYQQFTTPVTFDLDSGYFWKGRKNPNNSFNPEAEIKEYASIQDIHALQIISEYCRSDKSSYYSYELNLILHDGTRINVVDHGNVNKLRDDAQKLAEFLNVPVWDIT